MAGVSLLSLPVEDVVLPHILNYLLPLEIWPLRLVCKHFYHITYLYYETMCHEINYEENSLEQTSIIYHILKHCHKLQRLTLKGSGFISSESIPTACTLQDCLLAVSINGTRELDELKLQGIHFQFSSQTLVELAPCCRSLQVLHLFSVFSFYDLDVLLQECTSLKEYRSDSPQIDPTQLTKVLLKQQKLEILELAGYSSPFPFKTFLISLPLLHTISLSHIPWISDRTIQEIAEYCSQLQYCQIYHCPGVTWKGLECLRRRKVLIKTTAVPSHIQPTTTIAKYQI